MEVVDVDLLEKHMGSGKDSENLYIRFTKTEVAEVLKRVNDTEDLGIDLLEGLDSYLEDIDDRLTISRMVSDSVIKGIVEAVEEMAKEKIAAKELEIATIKENMCSVESRDDQRKSIIEVSNGDHFQQLGVQITERMNEVMNVKMELNSLLKSLPGSESGLVIHGGDDMDHLNKKLFNNHVFTPSSSRVENGHSEVTKNGISYTWDVAQLRHLGSEELVSHFKSIITKMKRDHELQVQKMTEDYFSLKREYFKEKGFSLPHRKEKDDLDIVRKKIPEVVEKLDNILAENEKMLTFSKDSNTLTKLKDRVDNLLLENHQLSELVSNKEMEIKNLNVQVSLLQGNLKKFTGDLESTAEDAGINSFLIEEVYGCFLRELIHHKSGNKEELPIFEDSNIELFFSQGISEVIFRESIVEAKSIINDMTKKYLDECNNRTFLQSKSFEIEEELKSLMEEKGSLKRKVDSIETTLEEKEKLVGELSTELFKERDEHKLKMNKVKQEFELMSEKLSVAIEERDKFYAIVEKTQVDMAMLESAKSEQSQQMQSVIGLILGLSRDFTEFESKVAEDIIKKSLRLEQHISLLQSLLNKSNILKRTVTVYKQKLEKKCADLQTAETEVDLLGDQVDTLFNLLEKIYIALDHYSPILQHYPGIMEILKLIRRELNGDSLKSK